jgi:hypothetical protein
LRKCITLSLLLVFALGLGNVGCHGIYRESEEIYPPDPCARLKLKLDQARQAQKQVEQAATRLRDRVAKGVAGKALEPDIDRLEMEAREFGRRVAAVSDSVAGCEQSDQFAAQVQSLRKSSAQMLETVQLIRRDDLNSKLPLIDRLLASPTQP